MRHTNECVCVSERDTRVLTHFFSVCVCVGEYLEKIIPLVVKFCNVDDDELREYCIQAFESFVRR